jgi:hypothetical protein
VLDCFHCNNLFIFHYQNELSSYIWPPILQPEREDEMARVEAAGGRVIYWNGYRVFGVLAMSRAIGMCGICLQLAVFPTWFRVQLECLVIFAILKMVFC